jgi:MCM AAA-lid domain
VRMSEAHARLCLRDQVRSDDIDLAIRIMLESFISSQKFAIMKRLNKVVIFVVFAYGFFRVCARLFRDTFPQIKTPLSF